MVIHVRAQLRLCRGVHIHVLVCKCVISRVEGQGVSLWDEACKFEFHAIYDDDILSLAVAAL